MWKTGGHNIFPFWEKGKSVENTMFFIENTKVYVNKKIHNHLLPEKPQMIVDNVSNYFPKRCSPMFTTSPAPIVINKSFFLQFINK